jgi:hypothetical protein
MPPLLKKKSEANAPQVPAWHPNFRNFEKLPDTKVVRTAFFINVIAITVALVLLLFVGNREWELYALKQQVAEKQHQIDQTKPGSDQSVALFKKYQAEEAKVLEVESFVSARQTVSDLLIHLGQTLPKNIALDRFDLRDAELILGATVRGAPDQASGLATAYIEQLRADKTLANRFDDIKPANSSRNAQTGRISIEVSLHLKGAAFKGGKK